MSRPSELPPRLTVDALPQLLTLFRKAVSHSRPEAELVKLLAKLTGGYAEIRASWGDSVAAAGHLRGTPQEFKLAHAGRNVGRLRLEFPAKWAALVPVAVEYALLARLQSAAAGAARRRVGERTLDALLEGRGDAAALGNEPFALALATYGQEPGRGASARAAYAHALDVLAGVGEGYFAERGLRGFCTVHADCAVWLWPVQNLEREARELFTALSESTGQQVRLGISSIHRDQAVSDAYTEAEQSLNAVREAGLLVFSEFDALHALLKSEALGNLRTQVLAQLANLQDGGKVESTLRAFLTHSGTLEELAEKQNIHVNTLRYRLKLAEKAVKGPLNDPAIICRLFLALGS